MRAFWSAARECLRASSKSVERINALDRLGDLTDVRISGIFPKLNIQIILFQLILRILKPERINQMQFGLCGPAHFAIALIKTRPWLYAQMACSLLFKGQAKGDDGYDIIPDSYVRDFDPQNNIPQADWLIAGTLRNAETPIPPGKDMGQYGGTRSPDVFAYCLHAGYSKVISLTCYESGAEWLAQSIFGKEQYHPEESKTYVPHEFGNPFDPLANIHMAAKLRDAGWQVLLKVNEQWVKAEIEPHRLEKAKQGDKFILRGINNELADLQEKLQPKSMLGGLITAQNVGHWVLAKKIKLEGENISASVYTWGRQYTPRELPLATFVNAYGGFVAAIG